MKIAVVTIPNLYGAYFARRVRESFPDAVHKTIYQGPGKTQTGASRFAAASFSKKLELPGQLLRKIYWKQLEARHLGASSLIPGRALSLPDSVLVDSINSESSLALMAGFAPDVILIFGGSIVSSQVLACASKAALNLHAGKLPEYRGSNTLKWMLYHGDIEGIRATVHIASDGVDSGAIVEEARAPIGPGDSYRSIFAKLHAAGTEGMIRAAGAALRGDLSSTPQVGTARTYRSKEWTERHEAELSGIVASKLARGPVSRIATRARFQFHKRAHGAAPWLLKPRLRVPRILLYHHVDSSESDWVKHLGYTIDTSHFEEQIAWLKSKYRIVPYSRIASGDAGDDDIAITFDDGLRSVLTTALPILERYGCPFKVYLTGGNILGELNWMNRLSWLLSKLGPEEIDSLARAALRVPVGHPGHGFAKDDFILKFDPRKTPSEIEKRFVEMGAQGSPRLYLDREDVMRLAAHPLVELGSHTGHHYPLVSLNSKELHEEVVGWHKRLNTAFDGKLQGFSIPFGYRSHVTPEISRAIAEVDSVVVSAYGGSALPVYRHGATEIRRVPIWGNLGTLWYLMDQGVYQGA